MESTGIYDTLWLTLIILGVGGLAFGLSLMVKLRTERSVRRRRRDRSRTSPDQMAHDL